jgi:hypothetical protein
MRISVSNCPTVLAAYPSSAGVAAAGGMTLVNLPIFLRVAATYETERLDFLVKTNTDMAE